MKILVTGSAGFIGFHLVEYLVKQDVQVVGIDNLNEYYDINLKYGRLLETGIQKEKIEYAKQVKSDKYTNYCFYQIDLTDRNALNDLFRNEQFNVVCNLAAQAGVRYSINNPQVYIDSNIQGFFNILESCRYHTIQHLIYASSSSVYGLNKQLPFSVHHNVDHPISLYAACKKSNELMAHTYSHLFNIPTTALRFFTVYGPWGRPDMALFLFTKAIIEGKPIQVYNNGNMQRDFTYVTDIVEGIGKVIESPPRSHSGWDASEPDPSSSSAPYKVYNLDKGSAVRLMDFITEIEKHTGIQAKREFLPLQDGDVAETWADIEDLERDFHYTPKVTVEEGVAQFINWYRNFYKVSLSSAEKG